MDGIFRTYLNKIEYGAIEVDFEETKIRKLQIPGILHLVLRDM